MILIYANGDVYEGEWDKDVRSGYGVLFYEDGYTEEGEWRYDKFMGEEWENDEFIDEEW